MSSKSASQDVSVASLEQSKIRDGFLKKWTESGFGRWNKRWVVVTRDAIYYFNSKTDKSPAGVFEIAKYNEVVDEDDFKGSSFVFKIHNSLTSMRKGLFSAESEEEKQQWIALFREAIKRGETQSLMKDSSAYRVHGVFYIRVAEARNLTAKDVTGLSDPYCLVQVGAYSVTTQTVWKSLDPLWAEDFTFNMDHSLPNTSAVVTVFDRDEVGHDELIGTCRTPIRNLIHQQTVENWIPLEHLDETNYVSGEINVELVYRLSASQVDVRIIEGRGLAQKDSNGLADPYIRVSHGGNKHTTPVVKKTLNPVWNYNCSFKVTIDNIKEGIKLIVKDKDVVSDEFMGSAVINLSSLPANVKVSKWYPLTADHLDEPGVKLRAFAEKPTKSPGDIRLKMKYTEVKILKLDEYEQFWKLLEQPDYTIVDALGEVTSERDEVAKNLVRLFQAKSKSIPLLIHLTAQEVKNTPTSDVLFRGNSIATKAVDAFMKLIGGNFLRKTIGKKVREIIASKRSCEVDPTKLEKGENIEENQKHLVDIVKSVSDVIFASAEATPIEFRLVFTELQKYVLEKFGEKTTPATPPYQVSSF